MLEGIFLIVIVVTFLAIFFRPLNVPESIYVFIAIIFLLITGILRFTDLGQALISFDVVKPYAVLVFFITFAILSTGLDELGFFEYLSIKAIQLAKHDGLKLYKYLFVLSAVVSYVAANDIVILTLTPFILYFTKYTKIKARGYLISMFVVANTASIGQITSNPTNFIVSMVFDIAFLENLLYMFLPTILGLIAIYFILKKVFYKEFNLKYKEKKTDLSKIIKNKYQCRIFVVMLLVLMLFFAVAPLIKLELWIVSAICALLAIFVSQIKIKQLLKDLPWNVVVLVTGLFILLYGFISTGLLYDIIQRLDSVVVGASYYVFLAVSFLVTLICGIFNNIPSTALLSSILYNVKSVEQDIIAYAIIIGSNVGANITILGSLAGIMWFHLIKKKKHKISLWDFTKYGIIATVPFVIIVTIVLYAEFLIFK